MAKLIIKNDKKEIEIPNGAAILHYLWNETNFPQGCEDGSNSTCACVILKGEENLNQKTQRETETLERANLPNSKRNRLVCQIRILKGEVEIEY